MLHLKSKEEESKVIIATIMKKVDSQNSEQLDHAIQSMQQENPGYKLILDAEYMPYISSSGLRVLLKLRKQQGGLKIINVSTDVYEIFEVTGFTDILEVEKVYRKISVEGCKVIGEGSHGKVYQLNADTVVKVYEGTDSIEANRQEQDFSKKAFLYGIPTAIPFDIVKCGENYGLVYELIDADTLSAHIARNPDKKDEYAKKWAELLKTLHSADVKEGELPNLKDILRERIDIAAARYLTKEEATKLHGLVERIPNRTSIVHGDAHVKNIMMQKDEAILIDMASICVGHPIYDFSSTYMSHMMIGDRAEKTIGISEETCREMYIKMLHYYFNIPQEESVEQLLKVFGLFAMLNLSLVPVYSAQGEVLAQKIMEPIRQNFFPIIDQLPGNMLDILS